MKRLVSPYRFFKGSLLKRSSGLFLSLSVYVRLCECVSIWETPYRRSLSLSCLECGPDHCDVSVPVHPGLSLCLRELGCVFRISSRMKVILDNLSGSRAYKHDALDRLMGSLRRLRDRRWRESFVLLLRGLTWSCLLLWPMAWSFTTWVFLSLFAFVSRDYAQTVRYVEELEERLTDLQEQHFEGLGAQRGDL